MNLPLPSSTTQSNQEFRKYRKLVAWLSLSIVTAGSIYLLISVGVSIQRQRNAEVGARISERYTDLELRSCHEALHDVSLALEKHLESAYHLLRGYQSEEALRWAEEGGVWRRRWQALGERCRLAHGGSRVPHKEMEAMTIAYQELGNIQTTYSQELLRFGKDLAPRLDRLKKRLDQLGEKLFKRAAVPGEY